MIVRFPHNDSKKYKGKMRLWAYGGSIAIIDSETGHIAFLKESRNYIPYLCDGFRNNKRFPEEFWQEGLFENWICPPM